MAHRKIDNRKGWRSRLKRLFTAKQSIAPPKIRIDLYAACWNEERMIPFFLRHYEPIADRIVIFDDGSSDRSRELLTASPKVELRQLAPGPSYVLRHMVEMNHCWKESRGRADWVIICDIDEQVYHNKGLRDYLERCRLDGVTILYPVGVEMVSAEFPPASAVLSETVRQCVRSFILDKMAVFDPNAIEEINYRVGRHVASPTGRLIFPAQREVKVLHYKYLGLDYSMARSKDLRSRKTAFDWERGWGAQYLRPPAEFQSHFEELLREAEDISLIGKHRAVSASDEVQRKL